MALCPGSRIDRRCQRLCLRLKRTYVVRRRIVEARPVLLELEEVLDEAKALFGLCGTERVAAKRCYRNEVVVNFPHRAREQ